MKSKMKSRIKLHYDGQCYTWQCPICMGSGMSKTLPESDIVCRCSEVLHPASVHARHWLRDYRKSKSLTMKRFSKIIAPDMGREPRTIEGWERFSISVAAFKLLRKILKSQF